MRMRLAPDAAVISASARPTRPKPRRTTSLTGRARARPPPIFDSRNAEWTARAASPTCVSSTTNEMFSSEEPCAIAITFTLCAASAPNTRPAMPGVPAMPRPTTATTATPRRAVTPSTSPAAISSRNADSRARTARAASASGSVKPIELSDEDWKMVDTDTPAAWTDANVRAAMPGTPMRPLPATVTSACPRIVASAFTG